MPNPNTNGNNTSSVPQTRRETDSFGAIDVPATSYWGAQTQRALHYFNIGSEVMPSELIEALGIIKKAAAIVNQQCGVLSIAKAELIITASSEVIAGEFNAHFPLHIWQSGSGTQTNMNLNEVIANRAIELAGGVMGSKKPIHPNDDVNMSQSTNDVFPSAMHIAAYIMLQKRLLPALTELNEQLTLRQDEFKDVVKSGRTHLQDAVPLTLGQEFSGYVAALELCVDQINFALTQLQELAIGGTAVGTGINAPAQFDIRMATTISKLTGYIFHPARNKFAALATHEAMVAVSSALKNLACTLFKIADDIRWLASGPRCGLGELTLPSNEPGSSIMPGKVNPTQCEMVKMVAAQVVGNDATITFAAAQGKFELNDFKPVIIHSLLQSIILLSDACCGFSRYVIKDLVANRGQIKHFLERSLMLVTALVPKIGYDKAAEIAALASDSDMTLRAAALQLGYIGAAEFDDAIKRVIESVKQRS